MSSSVKHVLVACALVVGSLSATVATASTASAASWMVFAVDNKGAIGHGVAPDLQTARNFALSYCGAPGCETVFKTVKRCHAIAHSFTGGYWFGVGSAPNIGTAMGNALNFCAENAPASSCKIAYKHCQ